VDAVNLMKVMTLIPMIEALTVMKLAKAIFRIFSLMQEQI
jgi:hypothetical protein